MRKKQMHKRILEKERNVYINCYEKKLKFINLIIILLIVLSMPPVFARQQPAPYSLMVKWATKEATDKIENAVYIWPWVKNPGSYSLKKGMTVAELVKESGGFIKDERLKDIPSLYVYPDRISVYRPSFNDPDPIKPVFIYTLNWSKTNGNISECSFELQIGDFVEVSFR